MSGSGTIYTEQSMLGHTLGFSPMAFPAQVFVGLCSAAMPPSETVQGVEAFGNGYQRMPATFALIATPANIAANVATVEYPMASGGWGTLGFFELWDAPAGGNRLYWGALIDTASQLTTTITVGSGDIVRFSAGTLAVQATTGAGGTGSVGAYLPLAGGTLLGPLLLAADPTTLLGAATKQYVDAHSGTGGGPGFLALSGGTMLGPLTITATGATAARSIQDRWHDNYSVTDFGAVMDGTTSDQTPLTNAFVATPALGTIHIPAGNINVGGFAPTSKPVLWKLDGTYTGSGTLTLSTLGNGVVETMYGTWSKWFNRGSSQGITNLGPVVRMDMALNHAGGAAGGVPTLQVNAQTTAASTPNAAPYGIVASLTMGSTQAGGAVGTALAGYAVKSLGAGPASPFGGNFYSDDQTGLSSGNGGSAVGAEIDVKANKLDDGVAADGYNINNSAAHPGSNRVVLALQYGRSDRSDNTPMEVSTVLQMGLFSTPIDGPYCSAKNIIKAHGTVSFAGLNFLHASFNAGAQAIALQNEQTIGWTTAANTNVPTAASWNVLQYRIATNRLYYVVGGVDMWSVDASGNVRARGTVTGSTTP